MSLRRILFAIIVPALVAGTIPSAAFAQAGAPSVSIRPNTTTTRDPNGGQWFFVNLDPGTTKRLEVQLYNPTDVPQTLKLYLADMTFTAQGVAQVANTSGDVGTWGRFAHPRVTIAPRQTLVDSFSLTAPKGADPGDHIGAVVAEHAPTGDGNIQSIGRVAVRLYATLPGDARKDFAINEVSTKKDSSFFTRELDVTVRLRNTGRVRLESIVTVDGARAKGSALLMSRSTESYIVSRPVRFWGGPMRLLVNAETRSLGVPGPARQMRVTVWVIPWHLLVLLVVAAGLVLLVRMALRKRGRKFQALQADLQRLERLLAQKNREEVPDVASGHGDADAAIRGAIKQAKRSGDHKTAERLERKRTSPATKATKGKKSPSPRPKR